MSKTFKLIWNVVTSSVVAVVVLLALLLAGPRLLGMQVFTVLSGSMEPVYHTGSLIYVKDIEDTRAIPDGTVITYMASEDTIVTHRIVTAVPDENDSSLIRYRTKGDANDVEDGTLVHYKNILGTPVFTIPALGYLANYIQNPPGSYMTICFGALFILLLFLPELLAVFFENEEEKPAKMPRPERKPRRKPVDDFPYEEFSRHERVRRPLPYEETEETPVYRSEPIYEEPFTFESDPVPETYEDIAAWLYEQDFDDSFYEHEERAVSHASSTGGRRKGGAHAAR